MRRTLLRTGWRVARRSALICVALAAAWSYANPPYYVHSSTRAEGDLNWRTLWRQTPPGATRERLALLARHPSLERAVDWFAMDRVALSVMPSVGVALPGLPLPVGVYVPVVGRIFISDTLIRQSDPAVVEAVLLHELVHVMEARNLTRLRQAWHQENPAPIADPRRYGYRAPVEHRAEAGRAALRALLAIERGAPPHTVSTDLHRQEETLPGTLLFYRWLSCRLDGVACAPWASPGERWARWGTGLLELHALALRWPPAR